MKFSGMIKLNAKLFSEQRFARNIDDHVWRIDEVIGLLGVK